MPLRETLLNTVYPAQEKYWDRVTLPQERFAIHESFNIARHIGLRLQGDVAQAGIRTDRQTDDLLTNVSAVLDWPTHGVVKPKPVDRDFARAGIARVAVTTPSHTIFTQERTYTAKIDFLAYLTEYPFPFAIAYSSKNCASLVTVMLFPLENDQRYDDFNSENQIDFRWIADNTSAFDTDSGDRYQYVSHYEIEPEYTDPVILKGYVHMEIGSNRPGTKRNNRRQKPVRIPGIGTQGATI